MMTTKQTLRRALLSALLMVFTTAAAGAQEMAGKWEGELNYSVSSIQTGSKLDESATKWGAVGYDWDFKKWTPQAYTIYTMTLTLEHIRGEKYKGTYFLNCKSCPRPANWDFNATVNGKELKGATVPPQRGTANPSYMELEMKEDNGEFYLEGLWRPTEKWAVWQGRVAVRRTEGNPAGGGNAGGNPPANPPAPDPNAAIEPDVPYHISRHDNDKAFRLDGDTARSDDGGTDDQKKWKFVAAPAPFEKYFRLVPVDKDDHALEADLSESSVHERARDVHVKAFANNKAQYWSLEKEGDGYYIVNVGSAGLVLEGVGDDGAGIVRERDAKFRDRQLWKLTKP